MNKLYWVEGNIVVCIKVTSIRLENLCCHGYRSECMVMHALRTKQCRQRSDILLTIIHPDLLPTWTNNWWCCSSWEDSLVVEGCRAVVQTLFRMMHVQNLFFIVKEGSLLTRVCLKWFCDIATKFVKKNRKKVRYVHVFLKQYVHVHLFWKSVFTSRVQRGIFEFVSTCPINFCLLKLCECCSVSTKRTADDDTD